MAGAFGSCLKGWGVVARAAVGPHLAWQAQHFGDASAEVVAGAVLRAPGLAFRCVPLFFLCVSGNFHSILAIGVASGKDMQAQYFVYLCLRSGIWLLTDCLCQVAFTTCDPQSM